MQTMAFYITGVVSFVLMNSVPGTVTEAHKGISVPMALRIAPPPMTFDNVTPKCWNFTHGNYQKMEFYSPGYPNKYTNDTDCVMYLEAPPHFKIQLDFRDTFKMEDSESCKYDYLEVRDGPFAYSPLIKRFCGESFPPLITSTTRYLWMRFKSDDLIQDDGFKAIYSYVKDHTQNDGTVFNQAHPHVCRQYLEISPSQPDGILSSTHLGGNTFTYHMPHPYDCTWEIHTDRKYGIYIRTYNLTMRRPQRCDQNYVALYKRTTLDKTKYVQYCAGPKAEMKTRENRVFIRLYSKTPTSRPDMVLSFTVYRNDVKVCSRTEEFECGDMCLPNTLLCNGVTNCPGEEDEVNCVGESVPSTVSALPLHTIIAGSIGGVLFTAIVIGICVSCYYKRRDSRPRKEDLKQQNQKIALKLAVSSPNTTSHSLSRMSGPGAGSSPASQHPQLTPQGKDNPHRYSFGSSVQHSSESDQVDSVPDNYKRFLSLEMTPDEESSPCPSLYSQSGIVTVERHPAIEAQYARFTSNTWRPDDPVLYPYTTLKKSNQFSVTKPFSYSPESKYTTSVPSLKYTNTDVRAEH